MVVGLGAMGSAATYHLARAGCRVVGIDRFSPPHDRGSSHGESRTIRKAYLEGQIYVPMVLTAYEWWHFLESETGTRLMTPTGGLTIGRPDSTAISGCLESARRHQLNHELLDAEAIRNRFPLLGPDPDFVGVFEPDTAIIAPEKAIAAQLALAERQGARLYHDTPAVEWHVDRRVTVNTPRQVFEAERVVVTAGAWSSLLLENESLPLMPRRAPVFWISAATSPSSAAVTRLPVHFWELPEGTAFYGHPQRSGRYKLAIHAPLAPCDPDKVDRQPTEAEAKQIINLSRTYLPRLNGSICRSNVCLYTTTPDGHFVIGRSVAKPQIVFAGGFSGHGFKFAGVIGAILADMALDRPPPFDISRFSPTRFDDSLDESAAPDDRAARR